MHGLGPSTACRLVLVDFKAIEPVLVSLLVGQSLKTSSERDGHSHGGSCYTVPGRSRADDVIGSICCGEGEDSK